MSKLPKYIRIGVIIVAVIFVAVLIAKIALQPKRALFGFTNMVVQPITLNDIDYDINVSATIDGLAIEETGGKYLVKISYRIDLIYPDGTREDSVTGEVITKEYGEDTRFIHLDPNIPFVPMDTGTYALSLTLTDLITGNKVERTEKFTIQKQLVLYDIQLNEQPASGNMQLVKPVLKVEQFTTSPAQEIHLLIATSYTSEKDKNFEREISDTLKLKAVEGETVLQISLSSAELPAIKGDRLIMGIRALDLISGAKGHITKEISIK